jgi:hypothetical protein
MSSKCPFCTEPCKNEHCPYSEEQKDKKDTCIGLEEENERLKIIIKDLQEYIIRKQTNIT